MCWCYRGSIIGLVGFDLFILPTLLFYLCALCEIIHMFKSVIHVQKMRFYNCKKCGQVFSDEKRCVEHEGLCTGDEKREDRYDFTDGWESCSICGIPFLSLEALEEHRREKHHTQAVNKHGNYNFTTGWFSCDGCGIPFLS